VLNSLSVIAVSLEIGLKYEAIRDGLKNFEGVGRRLERIGEKNNILVMDDYGHHPTEIRATLSALKNLGRRIVVIFQPHRYSRTKLLWDEFGRSFGHADEIFLTSIYPAGEEPIEGITSELICQSVQKHGNRDAALIDRFEDIADSVVKVLNDGDVVITLGAGDIYKIGPAILERIK